MAVLYSMLLFGSTLRLPLVFRPKNRGQSTWETKHKALLTQPGGQLVVPNKKINVTLVMWS